MLSVSPSVLRPRFRSPFDALSQDLAPVVHIGPRVFFLRLARLMHRCAGLAPIASALTAFSYYA